MIISVIFILTLTRPVYSSFQHIPISISITQSEKNAIELETNKEHITGKTHTTSFMPNNKSKYDNNNDGNNSIRLLTINQLSRPNACTYWLTPNILAGEYPTSKLGKEETRKKLFQYLEKGITYFIDLTQEGEKDIYESLLLEEANKSSTLSISYKRIPIQDFGIPQKNQMKDILDTIDGAVQNNQKVYVHCKGGIGRTGTTVGCYLVRHGYDGEEALENVNRLFQFSKRSMESSFSPETREQMNFVRDWNEE